MTVLLNFHDFIILSKDSNNSSLHIKESLLIVRDKPILNKAVKSFPLVIWMDRTWSLYNVLNVLFNKNVCNILNVTVMTMPWWNKAKAQ